MANKFYRGENPLSSSVSVDKLENSWGNPSVEDSLRIKKVLKFILNEFIYGGHLLALGSVTVVLTSAILLSVKITWDCLAVVYLGTYSVYLYNFFKEFKYDFLTNPQRTQHIKKYVKYIPIIIFCVLSIFTGILLYFEKISVLLFGILLLAFGFLYSEFLKGFTRKLIAFKNFFVALMWTLLVIFFAIYYSFPLNLSLFLILFFVYIRSFIDTSFFDIKDFESDKKQYLLTLPIILRKKKMVFIFGLMNILSIIPIIFGLYLNLFPISSLLLLLTIPYAFYCFKKLEDKRINIIYLSYFFTGGEKISWPIFLLLGELLL